MDRKGRKRGVEIIPSLEPLTTERRELPFSVLDTLEEKLVGV